MPDPLDGRIELVRGQIVRMPLHGAASAIVSGNIFMALSDFTHNEEIGHTFISGLGYVLSGDPPTVRRPDASYITEERIPANAFSEDMPLPPPDIVVEVVTPWEDVEAMREKVSEYLAAGVRLVWVLWTDSSMVVVHSPDAEPRRLTEQDTLDGGSVLPGFSAAVAELFETATL